MRRLAGLVLLFCAVAAQGAARFDGAQWWEVVKVLADDRFEGRETGSRGERQAQEYIVGQLKLAGAEPAGSDGYYQPVKLRSREIVEPESGMALIRNGQVEPLTIGEQFVLSARVDLAPTLEAPLVFVGYGLSIPSMHYDDFAGLNLKGKVAVYLAGSPAAVPLALAAHAQSSAVRWRALKAAGAIGMIVLPNPASMDIPWPRIAVNRSRPSMYLTASEFDETEGAMLAAMYNPAHAEQLFKGTAHTFAELAALGKDRREVPRFPLPLSVRLRSRLTVKDVDSTNVVATIRGHDPALRDEYVVLSAHIDHIGVGEPINGDRINNGAMDNASGSALLLELARSIAKLPQPLKRSILFVWVTAEEKGLLGSRYFAAYPTVPVKSMVADLNTDEFLPIVPLNVLIAYGLAESDLGDRLRRITAGSGVKVRPDPEPLRNIFIRSDQYNFVRVGIPSLMLSVGAAPGSPEEIIFKTWLKERYHAPSDDTNQPVDLGAAGKFEDIMLALTTEVANDPRPPSWHHDSFFRRFAAPAESPARAP